MLFRRDVPGVVTGGSALPQNASGTKLEGNEATTLYLIAKGLSFANKDRYSLPIEPMTKLKSGQDGNARIPASRRGTKKLLFLRQSKESLDRGDWR